MNPIKENAINELTKIGTQIQSIIEQLKENDVAYYNSPEIASIIPAISGMEWGVGINPKTGKRSFTAYFIKL